MSALRRVVIVDDEPTARQTTHAQLLPERYDLVLVEGGAEALRLLDGEPADLVICDTMYSLAARSLPVGLWIAVISRLSR